MSVSGCLVGIGVGPGDPELITLKAARAIEESPVVAYVAAAGRTSMARTIAARHILPTHREIPIALPMETDPGVATRIYDEAAVAIAAELDLGYDVALLCEGDPLLYGSFIQFLLRMSGRYACRTIPGVTSISAAAAAANLPLASRQTPLTVLPATLPDERLEVGLGQGGAVALLKIGRHLGRVRDVLLRLGALDRAVLVERASTPEEQVRPLERVDDERAPYFSLILIGERTCER